MFDYRDQAYYREKRREVGMAERPREEGGRGGRALKVRGREGWQSVQRRRTVGMALIGTSFERNEE